MTIHIDLAPATEAKLRQAATALGKDVSSVAAELLERAVLFPSVDDLLAPARKQVAESGMSEEQLDDLLRTTLSQVRGAQKAGKSV